MSGIPGFNPDLLILGRESRGLTQMALAQRLGVSQSTLSRLEDGYLPFPEDLSKNLERELCYPLSFYQRKAYREGARPTFYRKYASLPNSVLKEVVARLNVLKLQISKLLQRCEPPHVDVPFLDPEEHPVGPVGVARTIRRLWRIPDGPVKDLTYWAERAGCVVFEVDFGTRKIDGCGDFVGDVPIIFVNRNTPAVRARFTLAHEVGHLVMHRLPGERAEEEAHQFAAELLTPKEEIQPMLLPMNLERLARLKLHWRVSMQAILKRAEDLRVISPRTARHLWTLMGKAGYRAQEPYDDQIPREQPSALRDLLSVHLEDFKVPVDRLSDELDLFQEEFAQVYGLGPTFRVVR
jgi:Zn-dependent peptidase ImmA (M78 family)/DNA-binding XRE family transcriptional regulator